MSNYQYRAALIALILLASCKQKRTKVQRFPDLNWHTIPVNYEVNNDTVSIYKEDVYYVQKFKDTTLFGTFPSYRIRFYPLNGKLVSDTQFVRFIEAKDTTVATIQKPVYE